MAKGTSRWDMVEKKGSKKDALIWGAALLAFIFLMVNIIPIVQSTFIVRRWHKFVEDFTDSVNHAHKNGGITVVHGDEEYHLERSNASDIYMFLVDTGMGKLQKKDPEGADMYILKFPDGSEMKCCEVEIMEETRVNDQGVYISFTNTEGEVYRYDTDLLDPKLFLRRVEKRAGD